MDVNGARHAFFAEAEELLDEMEQALLSLGRRSDPEDIHRLFRAAHTVKGNSRLFPFPRVEAFAHRIEGLLDALRAGRVGITEEILGLLFRARDHLEALVADAAEGAEPEPGRERSGAELTAELEIAATAQPITEPVALVSDGFPVRWRVEWGIGPDLAREGLDPLAVLRCLSRNGCIQSPELRGGLPALAQLEPDHCYLSLGFDYLSDQPLAGIRQSFECCLDQSTLSITRADTLPFRADSFAEPPPPVVVAAAPGGGGATSREASPLSRPAEGVVRVDAARLEQLVNLVGELVIANAATSVLASHIGNEQLVESNATVTRLVEDIRDSALTLRMVPVGESFQRFERLAEEMGRELGKEVELTLSGRDVELDKAVAEKIGDQLMHLVRNAIDHGIETPRERAAAGKPARGRLSLNALHESGNVIIQVADDGRGMDLEKLLGSARAAGLVNGDRQPTQQEILQFAFEPGMSTAERVSPYSGRGVGLDAVRRKVESLRGSVELSSERGKGTTVSIRLPLTLSIIDGFQVAVAGLSYVLSLDSVIECIEVERGSARFTENHYTNLRGEVLPLLRLRELFGEPEPDEENRENILVVSNGRQKAGLVVDELLGEYQTVIKPLGRLFGKARGLSGATILGSGEVALILDVPQLIQSAIERGGASPGRRHRAAGDALQRHPEAMTG